MCTPPLDGNGIDARTDVSDNPDTCREGAWSRACRENPADERDDQSERRMLQHRLRRSLDVLERIHALRLHHVATAAAARRVLTVAALRRTLRHRDLASAVWIGAAVDFTFLERHLFSPPFRHVVENRAVAGRSIAGARFRDLHERAAHAPQRGELPVDIDDLLFRLRPHIRAARARIDAQR
jgi:hypothetical protein